MAQVDFLLASNSPRRRQLLGWTGWTFAVHPADIDETPIPGEKPVDHVQRLAGEKARAAARFAPLGSLVLGSDTVVVDRDEILGKPVDRTDAYRMLRQLRGKPHTVYTAIAVFDPQSEQLRVDLCTSLVPMRNYSDSELDVYIASGDPDDKAGAYAIQHAGFHPVENFQDCYACVMGLPLCHIVRMLRDNFHREALTDVPAVCQKELEYSCPVYRQILR